MLPSSRACGSWSRDEPRAARRRLLVFSAGLLMVPATALWLGVKETWFVIDRTLALKRAHRGVLGVPEYLVGIRDFGRFRCHPLLMPVILLGGILTDWISWRGSAS